MTFLFSSFDSLHAVTVENYCISRRDVGTKRSAWSLLSLVTGETNAQTILASTAILAVLHGSSAGALAQDVTVKGAACGAVTGAIVGGPVGAAVGGVAGAIGGTAIDPLPQEVVTYLQEQPAPAPVTVSQEIVVGEPVPETVVLTPVPSNEHYAVVNDQRVIIDPRTHTVVQIVS